MTAAAGVDPTTHRPDQNLIGGVCEFCGDLSTNPTRCPGWLLHRTRQVYRVEGWEDGAWTMMSSTRQTIPEANERMAALKRRFPELPMRIVAETSTYMVVATAPGTTHPADEREQIT